MVYWVRAIEACGLMASVLAITTSAAAVQPSPCRGDFCHDGFFLRFGVGMSAHSWGIREQTRTEWGDASGTVLQSTQRDRDVVLAPQLDVTIGGGGPGLAIGGFVQMVEYSWGAALPTGCAMAGPTVVGHPFPRRGYYLEGRVGLAGCYAWGTQWRDLDYSGGMLALGLGYERWVGRGLSIGGGADLSFAILGRTEDAGSRQVERSAWVIGMTVKIVVTVN